MANLKPSKRRLVPIGVFAALVASYVAVLARPSVLFAHSYDSSAITIHSRTPLDTSGLGELVEGVVSRIRWAAGGTPATSVFVTGSPAWHVLFNGPNVGGLARNSEIGNNIFIPNVDIGRGRVVAFDGREGPLPAILTHEISHTVFRRRVGVWNELRMPFWKKEGFAEYVATRDPGTLTARVALLAARRGPTIVSLAGDHIPRHYYVAGLLWEMLHDRGDRSFPEIIQLSLDPDGIERMVLDLAAR